MGERWLDSYRACRHILHINNDLWVDLTDAIMALQITSGIIFIQNVCVCGCQRRLQDPLSRNDFHPPEDGGDEIEKKMLLIGNAQIISEPNVTDK
jgi:hypothetical protein